MAQTISVNGGPPVAYNGDVRKAITANPNHNNTPINRQRPRRLRLS